MTTEKRSMHNLKVGDIVHDRGARMAVIAVEDIPNFAQVLKTVVTWVELVPDGEEPKTHLGTEPDAIGIHKDQDHHFEVEVS
jgi:hypothetical protein